MSTPLPALTQVARFRRLLAVLLLAVAAGLASDWLRTGQRLLFSRPVPVFVSAEPGK